MENQLFNLEKIRDLTKPLEDLQGKIKKLEDDYIKFENNKNIIIQNLTDNIFLNQVNEIAVILKRLNNELIKISNENVNKFLILQENLIKKYNAVFKENLKNFKLNQATTKKIGLFLIDNKKISKIIDKPSYVPSITLNQWLELLDSLKNNTLFILAAKKVHKFFDTLIKNKFQIEIDKIPENTDPMLIKEFEEAYLKDHELTFNKYLQEIESKIAQDDLEAKKKIVETTTEREKLIKLKKEQEAQDQSYQEYFKLPSKEFERRIRKRKREKLSQIANDSKNKQKIELSDEISEKIEKFKSKFENEFEEKYFIKKDDEKDPIELIRERQKKKEKEYQEYKDHFNKQ